VDEHDGAPAVELGEERLVLGRAEVAALYVGQQDDARCVERVEGVGDLLERGLDVENGHGRKEAEAAAMVVSEAGCELVHLAGFRSGDAFPIRLRAQMDAGRGDRDDRGRDLMVVHQRERTVDGP
jgi:hypothetical protein